MKTLAEFDASPTVTLIIAVWFGVFGVALLVTGELYLGGVCFWASGFNLSRWVRR